MDVIHHLTIWDAIRWVVEQALLPIFVGLVVGVLSEMISRFVSARRRKRLKEPARKARVSWPFLILGVFLGVAAGYVLNTVLLAREEYRPVLLKPAEGLTVGNRFNVLGQAERVDRDPYLVVVTHSLEKPGDLWWICDNTLISPNGWFDAVGIDFDQTPAGGSLQVYVFRTSDPKLYEAGEGYRNPPGMDNQGGVSNVVKVKKAGN
jgi:hypothetical protein